MLLIVPTEVEGEGPVLVVEDDHEILTLVADILRAEGFMVETATDGAEALQRLEAIGRPCVILLDMRLPVLDGWGFSSELRRRGLEVPVVVMTAAQNAQAWAREIGAERYLAKPFDLDHLLTTVSHYCSPST